MKKANMSDNRGEKKKQIGHPIRSNAWITSVTEEIIKKKLKIQIIIYKTNCDGFRKIITYRIVGSRFKQRRIEHFIIEKTYGLKNKNHYVFLVQFFFI